jgi:hypothetical protein
MATQAYTNTPKARLILSTTTLADDTLKLDGLDAEATQELLDFFTNSGALTTVAITALALAILVVAGCQVPLNEAQPEPPVVEDDCGPGG